MDLNTYQKHALRTWANHPTRDSEIAVSALGLAGESGEVVDVVKKFLGHGRPIEQAAEEVFDELGDVLYYAAVVARAWGFNLEDVAKHNVEKLIKRYPHGFKSELERELAPGI